MSARRTGVGELDAALAALHLMAQLTAEGHEAFGRSRERQLALAFCWVNVGSQLKQYVRVGNDGVLIDEMSPAVRMRDRLAYRPVAELDLDILWQTCVIDVPELEQFLIDLRASL